MKGRLYENKKKTFQPEILEKYKKVFESNPIPTYIWKIEDEKLILVDFNEAAVKITNGGIENYMGITVSELYKFKPEILKDFKLCLDQKIDIYREIDYTYITTNKIKELKIHYKYIPEGYIIVYTEDITQQKLFEKSLLDSEKEKRLILSNILELVVFQDKSHNIIWTNKAAANSVGVNIKELIGKKCYSFWCNSDGPLSNCPVDVTLKKEIEASNEIKTSDGRFWNVNSYPVYDDNHVFIGAVEVVNEITKRKIAEEQLMKSESMYRKAYDRSEFFKDLFAHDINNIFQSILSSIELIALKEKVEGFYPIAPELIQLINDQLKRGIKLASNVRKISELENFSSNLYRLDVVEKLQHCIEFMEKSFKHKEINFIYKSEFPKIFIDANDLIVDVFENIIFNSINHNANSIIEICISILKQSMGNKNYVRFEFADNGIGIADSEKESVFIRVDNEIRNLRSSGLGLKLVKKIIEIFNGKIWVEDRIKGEYSKGSKFIFLIPESGESME